MVNRFTGRACASLFILHIACGGSPAAGQQRAIPVPAMDAIFRAFGRRDIVLLGEIHWNVAQHQFIQRLLSDPRLPEVIRDVAVEFANALYQPLIDRYIAGEDVPSDSLALVWRNTVNILAWDRPMYGDIFRTIRAVNRELPRDKRLRVVALDPPIEWRMVTAVDQLPRVWGYRDPVWFEIFEREVLAKGHKALVIAGGLHILRRDPPDFAPKPFDRVGFGDALAQRYAAQVYRIYPAVRSGALGRALGSWPGGTLSEVAGTALGARSASILWPSTVTMLRRVNGKIEPYTLKPTDFPPIDSLVDAILFYGSAAKAPWPLEPFRDSSYVAELRRRNELLLPVFGQDQRQQIDSLARAACRETVRLGSRACNGEPGS